MKQIIILILVSIFAKSTIAQSSNPFPYCSAVYADTPMNYDMRIISVYLNNLYYNDINPLPYPHYIYYDNLNPAFVSVVSQNTFSATFYGIQDNYYAVWIDFNQDSNFTPNEYINGGYAILNSASFSFNCPGGTLLGNTRMRVRTCNYLMNASDGCDTLPNGETEDYQVLLNNNPTETQIHQAQEKYRVYPNPACNHFQVSVDNSDDILNVVLYNTLGKKILQQECNTTVNKTFTINTSSIEDGIYILQLKDSKLNTKTFKIEIRKS